MEDNEKPQLIIDSSENQYNHQDNLQQFNKISQQNPILDQSYQMSGRKKNSIQEEKMNLNGMEVKMIERKESIKSNQSKRSQKSVKSQLSSTLKPPRPPISNKDQEESKTFQQIYTSDKKQSQYAQDETLNTDAKFIVESKKNLIDYFESDKYNSQQKNKNVKLKPMKLQSEKAQTEHKIIKKLLENSQDSDNNIQEKKDRSQNNLSYNQNQENDSLSSSPQKQSLSQVSKKKAFQSTLGKSFWNLPLSQEEYESLNIQFHQKEAYDLIEQNPELSKKILPQYDSNRDSRWQFEDQEFSPVNKHTKKLNVLTLTYNMKGSNPISPQDMDLFLNTDKSKHHLVAIGFQECSNSIGQSFFCSSKQKWECQLRDHYESHGYYQVTSVELNAQFLVIFAHKSLKDQINTSRISKYSESTGFMNLFPNKGGIAIKLHVGEDIYLFITSHFASGQKGHRTRNFNHKVIARSVSRGRVKEINQQFKETSQFSKSNKINPKKIAPQNDKSVASAPVNSNLSQVTQKLSQDTPLQELFDYIFWIGDLNYRVDQSVLDGTVIDIISKKGFYQLLKQDQLVNQRVKGEIFNGFEEGMILFPPTYKLKTNENVYVDLRVPGWTDRILYSGIKKNSIQQVNYECGINVFGSDHRPVFAQFVIDYNPIDQMFIQVNQSSSHCCIC